MLIFTLCTHTLISCRTGTTSPPSKVLLHITGQRKSQRHTSVRVAQKDMHPNSRPQRSSALTPTAPLKARHQHETRVTDVRISTFISPYPSVTALLAATQAIVQDCSRRK